MTKNSGCEHHDDAVGRINAKNNSRKAENYWLGFLKGILASEKIEEKEMPGLRAEAELFLKHFGDADAEELLRDLETEFDDYHAEIFSVIEMIVNVRSRSIRAENAKDEANQFFGFCAGVACDDLITPGEVEKLLARIDESSSLLEDDRVLSLQRVARMAIADGRITSEESADICGWITRLVGDSCADTGLPTFGNVAVFDDMLRDHTALVFPGSSFVITGTFAIAPRKVLQNLIVDLGGMVATNLSGRTDYLVLASQASRDWKHSHEGLKIIKARELRAKGKRPNLVDEGVFRLALGDRL